MSSIIRLRDTFHGISVFGRGVFTNAEHGFTYAGQIRDGYACGLGVATWSKGIKEYAEHGPNRQFDGRRLIRWADRVTDYILYERRRLKAYSRGIPPLRHTRDNTQRGMRCCRQGVTSLVLLPARARACANDRMRCCRGSSCS